MQAAINNLVGILGLRIPSNLEDTCHLSDFIAAEQRPVVFIGPSEHHSNELPWRESIAEVVVIPQDTDGRIDSGVLEADLRRYAARPTLVRPSAHLSGHLGPVTAGSCTTPGSDSSAE